MSRVFSNLISNAIKYSDGDLEIVLSERGEVIFSNMASGLDEIQVGRLFERFYTVEAARKSTGLGLAISKTLVEEMNGTISAKYENGRVENMKRSVIVNMAKVLECSPAYLMGWEAEAPEEKPALTARDERDIKKDLDSIMEKLSTGEAGPASYDGEDLDPEAAELFKDELEIALRRLKLINKEKYTPQKYKK